MDKARLHRLNDEIQQKEEMLQEAKMEKERAVVELGREKDCNRVIIKSYAISRPLISVLYTTTYMLSNIHTLQNKSLVNLNT